MKLGVGAYFFAELMKLGASRPIKRTTGNVVKHFSVDEERFFTICRSWFCFAQNNLSFLALST